MRGKEIRGIPLASRWLIEVAAHVTPRLLRPQWKREWLWEVWHGHASLVRQGTGRVRASRQVAWFALGSFVDAGDLRMEHLRQNLDRRSLAREPWACLGALVAVLLGLLLVTGAFRHTRAALRPLYPDSQQLVLLSRPLGVLGMETPANQGQVLTWVEYSSWFGTVAGFTLRGDTLEVTPNFFSVLHIHPAEPFLFLGRRVSIVKVLDPARPLAAGTGAIARLKNPADRAAAAKQLSGFTVYGGGSLATTPLAERSRWPLYFAVSISAIFLIAGMLRARRRWQACSCCARSLSGAGPCEIRKNAARYVAAWRGCR